MCVSCIGGKKPPVIIALAASAEAKKRGAASPANWPTIVTMPCVAPHSLCAPLLSLAQTGARFPHNQISWGQRGREGTKVSPTHSSRNKCGITRREKKKKKERRVCFQTRSVMVLHSSIFSFSALQSDALEQLKKKSCKLSLVSHLPSLSSPSLLPLSSSPFSLQVPVATFPFLSWFLVPLFPSLL